jgi:Rrf2 family protein
MGKDPRKVTSLAEIERTQLISAKFAKQIMQPLQAHGLIRSRRGAAGGYALLKKPADIVLADILVALGEDVCIAPCADNASGCEREEVCGALDIWQELNDLISRFMSHTTIQDIIDREAS